MEFIDLEDKTPKYERVYMVVIKTTFKEDKKRKAYAEWTNKGFILLDTVLFNNEYIVGYFEE